MISIEPPTILRIQFQLILAWIDSLKLFLTFDFSKFQFIYDSLFLITKWITNDYLITLLIDSLDKGLYLISLAISILKA